MYENKTGKLSKYLPKPYKKRRYYNKSELAEHCTANDIWLCFFEDIYDLTPFIQKNIQSKLVEPIV
jgi:cytochrome b involved in lipid metabolism